MYVYVKRSCPGLTRAPWRREREGVSGGDATALRRGHQGDDGRTDPVLERGGGWGGEEGKGSHKLKRGTITELT